jgi:Fic family protein
MIFNNFLAMKRIEDLKKKPLTREGVLELHRILTDGTLTDPAASGRLRRPGETCVVGDDYGETYHVPPPGEELEARMEAMLDFANGKTPDTFIHPVLRAIILHFWLAYDHPFSDGNGRTARALFYWSMLRAGYWLFEFISISQAILKSPVQYYRAFLHVETDDNDLTYFLIYHLKIIDQALEELHRYLELQTGRIREVERRMQSLGALNHRQVALVAHALRHPGATYTFRGHQRAHAVVYQTARTDLIDLAAKGLLFEHKRGRQYVFTPAGELDRRLREL